MIRAKDDNMGRFSVDIELANYEDAAVAKRGLIPPEQIRRATIRGVVDSGATNLVIPEDISRQLGFPITGQTRVRCADGCVSNRSMVGAVQLSWGGRSSVFDAVVEPDRDSALVGAIVLEALDLVVDCKTQRLMPRDPNMITSEIE